MRSGRFTDRAGWRGLSGYTQWCRRFDPQINKAMFRLKFAEQANPSHCYAASLPASRLAKFSFAGPGMV